jgi:hypothetical protein
MGKGIAKEIQGKDKKMHIAFSWTLFWKIVSLRFLQTFRAYNFATGWIQYS